MTTKLISETAKFPTACGSLYITLDWEDEAKTKLIRVNANLGKSGTCVRAFMSSFNELILPHLQARDIKALTKARGHWCQFQAQSCINILIKHLIERFS